ncbi:Ribonucleoside-diphosphate reductase subunit M2 [Quaeritorhiza haematococci]|nr:Ribonucleoside-diphosphate reductase subunit M2 [Quaeritorhiza haematococci]
MLSAAHPSEQLAEKNISDLNLGKLQLDDSWEKPQGSPMNEVEEPLLKENVGRFVLFPIQYHDVWQVYKNAEAKFWSAEEIHLSDDLEAWKTLPGKEKSFVEQNIALIAAQDALLQSTVVQRLNDEIQAPEPRAFYGFQIMQRNIHKELFYVMLQTFAKDEEHCQNVFEAVTELPTLSKKAAWVETHLMESTENYATRLVAYALYFAVFFATSEVSLLYLAKNSKSTKAAADPSPVLPGVVRGLCRLHRDHAYYLEFAATLYRLMVNRPRQELVNRLAADAVKYEMEAIDELFAFAGADLTVAGNPIDAAVVKRYVQYVADEVVASFGFPKIWKHRGEEFGWIQEVLKSELSKDDTETLGDSLNSATVQTTSADVLKADQTFTLDADF